MAGAGGAGGGTERWRWRDVEEPAAEVDGGGEDDSQGGGYDGRVGWMLWEPANLAGYGGSRESWPEEAKTAAKSAGGGEGCSEGGDTASEVAVSRRRCWDAGRGGGSRRPMWLDVRDRRRRQTYCGCGWRWQESEASSDGIGKRRRDLAVWRGYDFFFSQYRRYVVTMMSRSHRPG